MSKISIVVDTTCDLSPELMESRDIIFIPLTVNIDGDIYRDKIDISSREFYEKISGKGIFPKTSLISPAEFESIFKNELDKGNEVVCITVSSKLSGTYNSANIAKDTLSSDRIHIIDGKTASSGSALLILEASRLAKEGNSIHTIINHIDNLIEKQKCMIYMDTMEMLKRGGRIPKSLATIGGMLKIKPILTVKDGELEPVAKVRGKKAAYNEIVDSIAKEEIDKRYPLMIAHANNLEYATEMITMLKDYISDMEVIISEIGPVVGTHSGEGTIAVWITKR